MAAILLLSHVNSLLIPPHDAKLQILHVILGKCMQGYPPKLRFKQFIQHRSAFILVVTG